MTVASHFLTRCVQPPIRVACSAARDGNSAIIDAGQSKPPKNHMPKLNPGDAPASGGPIAAALIADLAAASRILVAQGVVDGFGHVSMRHPRVPERYLMARSIAPALVTPDDIIEYDLDSNPCNAGGRSSFLERFIHGEIYKARPDIMSVVHSHSASVIPFGLVGVPMQAMFHNAAFLAEGVPVFDIRKKFGATDMLVSSAPKGVALAAVMGKKDIVLMRAHGSVACGTTLQSGVFRAVYTEVNARIQRWAMALKGGAPIAALDDEEGRLADAVNQTAGMRAWDLWRSQVRGEVNW
jgi:HCOMODA/2-hydroxy-3-carboxy-muconic semialdehyde decarboxylase